MYKVPAYEINACETLRQLGAHTFYTTAKPHTELVLWLCGGREWCPRAIPTESTAAFLGAWISTCGALRVLHKFSRLLRDVLRDCTLGSRFLLPCSHIQDLIASSWISDHISDA